MEAHPASDTVTEASVTLAEVDRFSALLRDLAPANTEQDALKRITAFEELKATLAAAQAKEALVFERLRIDRDALNRVPAAKRGVRAGDEIGFARKTSPGSGRKFLTTARTLTDLPHTFDALKTGVISEAKAKTIADELTDLGPSDRRAVDHRMRNSLGDAGIKSLRHEARALAVELAADDAAQQTAQAVANRRVTVTSLTNGMGHVSATVPLVQAIAAYEGLKTAADSIMAQGDADGRRHSQVMTDVFVERLTGQDTADAVPVEVLLVIEAESLLSVGQVPAWLPGYGSLPAKTARNYIAGNTGRVFLRRLFTTPHDGQLVGMESRGRVFPELLRRMIVLRDDVCRTPWCDAPIRHADHTTPVAAGGQTEWTNSSGLCASCNYAKEHPGWRHDIDGDDLIVATPAGQRYRAGPRPVVTKMSIPRRAPTTPDGKRDWKQALAGFLRPAPPPPPRSQPNPPSSDISWLEHHFRTRILPDSG
ncbi:HNH endonuclease [Brevibacterium sp.]|uniref:HNH endonuclease n=1 Tax=Brevibacterium sp. TaxID=1701 RepID=UPI002811C588|nr:HNH endonuclease [Brevibacterium sp.]